MQRPPLPRAASAGALADRSFPPEAEEGHAPLQRPLGVTSERLPQGMRTLHQGFFFPLPALCFSFFLVCPTARRETSASWPGSQATLVSRHYLSSAAPIRITT